MPSTTVEIGSMLKYIGNCRTVLHGQGAGYEYRAVEVWASRRYDGPLPSIDSKYQSNSEHALDADQTKIESIQETRLSA